MKWKRNVFLLRFISCPVGSDWSLVVFSTVLQSLLVLSWFVLCSLSRLWFQYFAVGLCCCWSFECAGCWFGSFNCGLSLVLFMLELRFRCCTSCWSRFICCFIDFPWFLFVDEVVIDSYFPLLLMFKVLSCSSKDDLFACVLLSLVFLVKVVLCFKMSE